MCFRDAKTGMRSVFSRLLHEDKIFAHADNEWVDVHGNKLRDTEPAKALVDALKPVTMLIASNGPLGNNQVCVVGATIKP